MPITLSTETGGIETLIARMAEEIENNANLQVVEKLNGAGFSMSIDYQAAARAASRRLLTDMSTMFDGETTVDILDLMDELDP